ncbi:unconventional myosin-XV-like [Diadema setosum]|uniref:unconventional myosin-XV-like n=1 Tax=Diadema setosum TaxID=31175 RepID=UPI003B3A717C
MSDVDLIVDQHRDGIAKSLYTCLFAWLVRSINSITGQAGKMTSIAILDIFGFEVFQVNGFEQLCINYANEHLQFYFNKHIFQLEQMEYAKEKIQWQTINYVNNQPVLDLLAKRPTGILHLVDDESNFPKGTEKALVEKCHYHHTTNPMYGRPKQPRLEFCIKHYAGPVVYYLDNFITTNRDVLKPEVMEMFKNSHNPMLADMFVLLQTLERQRAMMLSEGASGSGGLGGMRKMRPSTVVTRFNESLLELIGTMNKCHPFFVRCIKPNEDKAPMVFSTGTVLSQLRYSGMLETVRIRRNGFPIRMTFLAFMNRYRFLISAAITFRATAKELCQEILFRVGDHFRRDYQLGATKVFLKEALENHLEYERSKIITGAVLVIQRHLRGYLARRHYRAVRRSTLKLQALSRGYLARRRTRAIIRGVVCLQALHRGRMQRRAYYLMLQKAKEEREAEERRKEQRRREEEEEAERRRANEEAMAKLAAVATASPSSRRPLPTLPPTQPQTDLSKVDIPYELHLLLKSGWNPPHTERNLIKVVGQVAHHDRAFSFPTNINDNPFSKYVNIYFKSDGFGFMDSPITTGFHLLNEADNEEAIAVFKLILRFITMTDPGNDATKKTRDFIMGNYIVQKGLNNPNIRDEIYCQVCNQTWNNSSNSIQERAWLLLSNIMAAFPPSPKLYNYLLKYVSDHAYNGYKAYCQHKLLSCDHHATESRGSRTYPPTLLEWKAHQLQANMSLVTRLPGDEEPINVQVDSWTTGEEFAMAALKQKGLQKEYSGWSVELMDENVRFDLSGLDFVMDLISEMEVHPEMPVSESHFIVAAETIMNGRMHHPRTVRRREQSDIENILYATPRARGDRQAPPQQESVHARLQAKYPSNLSIPEPDYASIGVAGAAKPQPERTRSQHSIASLSGISESGLEDYVSHLFNPETLGIEGSGTEASSPGDLASPTHLNNVIRGGGRGPMIPTHPPVQPTSQPPPGLIGVPAFTPASAPMPAFPTYSGMVPMQPAMQPALQPAMQPALQPAMQPALQPAALQPTMMQAPVMMSQAQMADPALSQQAYLNQQALMAQQLQLQQTQQQLMQTMQQLSQQTQQTQAMTTAAVATAQTQVQQQQSKQPQVQPSLNGAPPKKRLSSSSRSASSPTYSSSSPSISPPLPPPPPMSSAPLRSAIKQPAAAPSAPSSGEKKSIHFNQEVVSITTGSNGETTALKASPVSPPTSPAFPVNSRGIPPPPPPPPPPPQLVSKGGKTIPMDDVKDRARTVRIGKIVWPPRKAEEQKQEVEVGRLQLEQSQQAEAPQQLRTPVNPITPEMLQGRASTLRKTKTKNIGPKGIGHVVASKESAPEAPPPARVKSPPPVVAKKYNKKVDHHAEALLMLQQQMKTAPPPSPKKEPPKTTPPPPPPPPIAKPASPPPPPKVPSPPPAPVVVAAAAVAVADPAPPPPPPPPPPPIVEEERKEIAVQATQTETEMPSVEILKAQGIIQEIDDTPSVTSSTIPDALSDADVEEMEKMQTLIYPVGQSSFYMYTRVRWNLTIRKEVFTPGERLGNPTAQQLIFSQIVYDVFSNSCIRMRKGEKRLMASLVDKYGITPKNVSQKSAHRKEVIEAARQLPLYFARFFPVHGGSQHRGVRWLCVSDNGIYLVSHESDPMKDQLVVMESFNFSDLGQLLVSSNHTLKISLADGTFIPLFTTKAAQIKSMVDAYVLDLEKDSLHVRAIQDYITRETTLLSFHKGDIIKVTGKHHVTDPGWLFGMLDGRSGLFPKEMVISAPGPQTLRQIKAQNRVNIESRMREEQGLQPRVEQPPATAVPNEDQKRFSMPEFASKYFRESSDKFIMQRKSDGSIRGSLKFMGSLKRSLLRKEKKKMEEGEPTSMQQSMQQYIMAVSFTNSPIQASLIEITVPELNKTALECFLALMQIMGDYPLRTRGGTGQERAIYECVVLIIKVCKNTTKLRDEILCQVIKQVTDNRSPKRQSAQQGWRLLLLLTAYMPCSKVLRPYLFQYLTEAAAQDGPNVYSGLAAMCAQNMRKALRYGGRRVMPIETEVTNLLDGRVTKRQQFILPGGARTMLKVNASSVVADVLDALCSSLGLTNEGDRQEFGLFVIIGNKHNETMLQQNDYIMDVSTHMEQMGVGFVLLFRRILWMRPLRLENEDLVSIVYSQVRQDYIAGHLVILEDGQLQDDLISSIIHLAALQIKANDQVQLPTQKDINLVLPYNVKDKQQPQKWLNALHATLSDLHDMTPAQARARFVGVLQRWRLFGCSFFAVRMRSAASPSEPRLLAINKEGFYVLKDHTHEILQHVSLGEIVSSRRLKSHDGVVYFDVKHGDLMMQKVSRFETNQGLEIGELISKYSKAQESGTRREPQPVPSNYESDALTKLWPTPGPRQEETAATQPENGMEGHYQQPSTSSPNNMMIPAASTSTPVSPNKTDPNIAHVELTRAEHQPHSTPTRLGNPPAGGVRVMALPPLEVKVDDQPEYNNNGPDNSGKRLSSGSAAGGGQVNGYPPSPRSKERSLSAESQVQKATTTPTRSSVKRTPQASDNILKRGILRGKRK